MLSMLLIFLLLLVKSGFSQHECDMNCHFTKPLLDLETIKVWPKSCVTVCGDINLVGDTNVTSTRLGQIFHKLEYLHGNLRIERTKYTSLSFLSTLRTFDCFSKEFIMTHNPSLYDLSAIKYLRTDSPCLWSIYNNSKLDMAEFSKISQYVSQSDTYAYGNLKDIPCQNVRITRDSLSYYQNCTSITGGGQGVLKITKVGPSDDLSKLSNLKKVTGNIEVYETDLQNLSFMSNFQYHVGERFQAYNITHIHDNPKLTRLGWDSLKSIDPNDFGYSLSIENNHPDFCLTTKELQLFAEYSTANWALEATLCPDLTRKDGQKVCNLEPLSTLAEGCQHVIGELEIDADNEKYVGKLENMTNIYGSLLVQDTKELVDLSFLAKLRQIATLKIDGPPLLRILNNKKLQNVTLPKMKTPPYPITEDTILIIEGNSMEIFKNRRECMLFQKQVQTQVKYNGKSCSKLPAADGSTGRGDFGEWGEEH